jgi:hypothetical protein
MFSVVPLLHAGSGASLRGIWGRTRQKSKQFAAAQHVNQLLRSVLTSGLWNVDFLLNEVIAKLSKFENRKGIEK